MKTVNVNEVFVSSGPVVFKDNLEDGGLLSFELPQLIAKDFQNKIYVLDGQNLIASKDEEGFSHYKVRWSSENLKELSKRVEKRGFIDLNYWYETTEEEFEEFLRGSYGWTRHH